MHLCQGIMPGGQNLLGQSIRTGLDSSPDSEVRANYLDLRLWAQRTDAADLNRIRQDTIGFGFTQPRVLGECASMASDFSVGGGPAGHSPVGQSVTHPVAAAGVHSGMFSVTHPLAASTADWMSEGCVH
jgi:hypothetical protein